MPDCSKNGTFKVCLVEKRKSERKENEEGIKNGKIENSFV